MRLISAILLNPFWNCRLHFHQILMARLTFLNFVRNPKHVRDFIPKTWQRQKRKIGNFPFLAFRTIGFSNGKVRPSCYFGKSRTSVYSDDSTIKIQNLSSLITSSIKILSGKNRAKRRPDFVSRMRNVSVHYWKIMTNLLGWKIKKGIWKGAKMGIFGCFPCIYY